MKKLLFIFLLSPLFTNAQIITTIAGTGVAGYNGDSVAATAAQLNTPEDIAVDGNGNVYIADYFNNRIRKVAANTGIITTVVGTGTNACDTVDGVSATTEGIKGPSNVGLDDSGNLYVNCENQKVRKVTSGTNIINTVTNIKAENYTTDDSGNLFIYFGKIYKVPAATGTATVIAGDGTPGDTGDGGPATDAEINYAWGIAVDANDNVYIDNGTTSIRKIDAGTGIITTIAGTGSMGYSGDGGPATAAEFDATGIAIDASGNLYIADYGNNVIRKITAATGIITTIAGNSIAGYSGDGGPATAAQLNLPNAVRVDSSGNIYIADQGNHRIRKIIAGTTLVNNVSNSPVVSIYPNPATTTLTITNTEKITNVTITNLLGQILSTHEYNTKNAQVNVSDLPVGVYFVKINGTEVRKFVKE